MRSHAVSLATSGRAVGPDVGIPGAQLPGRNRQDLFATFAASTRLLVRGESHEPMLLGAGDSRAGMDAHDLAYLGATVVTRSRGVGVVVFAVVFGLTVAMLTMACDDADQSPAHVVTPAVEQPAVPPAPAPSPIPAGAAVPEGAPGVVAEPTPALEEPSPTLVPPAATQRDATGWLLEQLRHATGFRVRASAAVALGHKQNAAAEAGLIAALHDDHAAVRAAAASALSRFSSAAVQQALHQAQRDESDPTAARTLVRAEHATASTPAAPVSVPEQPTHRGVYLSVSKPRTKGPLDAEVLSHADAVARAAAHRLPSARLAPQGESRQGAENVLAAEGRAGYQLDTTFGLEEQAGGARATANVLVATYPGLALLGATKGAATVSGDPHNPAVQRMAMDAAIESAFSDLRRVFEADRR